MLADGYWLPVSMAVYFAAAASAVLLSLRRSSSFQLSLLLVAAALILHSVAIVLRWQRLDHGPYVNLFEILSSNIWSLHLAVLAACLFIARIRPLLASILPILQVLVLWLLVAEPAEGEAPVTYATIWLAVHVWLGKAFLGCIVVAVGLSVVVLLRGRSPAVFVQLPSSASLDELAYRFVIVGFIFESLMLLAGAIWAQDAWGRYWAWDPLETWAFITWLAAAAYLHMRATWRPSPAVGAVAVLLVFGLAFSTFFGMPFVSTAPHKGAV